MRELADRNFELLKSNSKHPSLHFKQVGRFWSARVGISWRALAVADGDDLVWFWIGSHTEYDKLLR
ncbi:ParE family toxin-like protein [Rhizobium tropici]|uniref:ParE family toxin-like protein n=1 Tax=Rhizobium tropici TaxID=398 RepID=UPI0002FB26D2